MTSFCQCKLCKEIRNKHKYPKCSYCNKHHDTRLVCPEYKKTIRNNMNCYKIKNRTWKPVISESIPYHSREDLRNAKLAEELGYTLFTSYHYRDGKEIPPDSISFEIGTVRIWFSVYNGPHWIAANIINKRYCFHRSYNNLSTALKTERR